MSENVITITTAAAAAAAISHVLVCAVCVSIVLTHLVVVEVGEARHGRAEQKQVAVRDGAHPLVVCARYHG
jgi:hypothetical protein